MSAAPGPAAVAPPAPAAAVAGEALLYDGEVVLLQIKPHVAYVVLGALGHLIALLVIFGGAWWLASIGLLPIETRLIATVAAGVIAARLLWQTLDWINRVYILTDRRVISYAGVLRRHAFTAPLRTIQHTEVYRTIPERILGLGSVGFATAGTAFVETWWITIARPHEAAKAVRDAIERYGRTG
jgi:uncharacterized membrane protein YdbT with pleckstrin-like domain